MFTGLIQSKGKILQISAQGKESRLHIQPLVPFQGYQAGESIAVNGVCLTVESFTADSFNAYASAETLSCSNLSQIKTGSEVNLERALRVGESLGGHIVSGHIDALCEVESVTRAGSSCIYRFSCQPDDARYIIPKGSVALDGVSLTVNGCGPDFFEVNIIPATQTATTIGQWAPGRKINLETDIIGKYVERMMQPRSSAGSLPEPKTLDLDFFKGNGFY